MNKCEYGCNIGMINFVNGFGQIINEEDYIQIVNKKYFDINNVSKFTYCPCCGNAINWNKITQDAFFRKINCIHF